MKSLATSKRLLKRKEEIMSIWDPPPEPYTETPEGNPQKIPIQGGVYDKDRLLVLTVVWGQRRKGLRLIWVFAGDKPGAGFRAWNRIEDDPPQTTEGFPSEAELEKNR
jgi:hypothetical protein